MHSLNVCVDLVIANKDLNFTCECNAFILLNFFRMNWHFNWHGWLYKLSDSTPGPRFYMQTVFPGIEIPITQIRRSWESLIFIMGIPTLIRPHVCTEPAGGLHLPVHCPRIKSFRSIPWRRHRMETFSTLLALVRGIHRLPVNSPHNGQWRGVLMFSVICARKNDWVNNREAGDLRRYRTHYDVTVMSN